MHTTPSRQRRTLGATSLRLAASALVALVGASLPACGLDAGVDSLFSGESTSASGAGGESSASATSGSGGHGASGSSVGGSSSTTSASGGSSSSGGGTEDCLNGVDDDGNGLADCEDPKCGAFECVDEAPAGWSGYYHVHQSGFPGPAEPKCADGSPADVRHANPAGPAMCEACSCGAPAGVTCSAPTLTCAPGSNNCGFNQADWTAAFQDGMCHKPTNLLGFNFLLSCSITAPSMPSGQGSCAPSTSDFPNKATWGAEVASCDSTALGAGCGAGKVCIAKGAGDPGESVCIRQQGTTTCPAGWTATTLQTFADATDTRGCSACTCGAASPTCNGGGYTFHDLDACAAGGDNPITVSGGCTNVSSLLDSNSWSAQLAPPTVDGNCPADGGAPTGSVQTSGPATYCCK